jgi:hypothetical protein
MGMTIDVSDFEKGFKKLVDQATPEAIAKGVFAAGNRLLQDAKNEAPQAPYLHGPLRRSGRVVPPQVTKDSVETAVGFNIEYAARWHEAEAGTMHFIGRNPINWTRKGSVQNPGPKYLETKMDRNKKRYLDLVGENLKALLGG